MEVRVYNAGGPTGFRVAYGVTADANASSVPEIDSSTACLPLAMVLIEFLVLSDRKRREILA